jgi:hypothetical protein
VNDKHYDDKKEKWRKLKEISQPSPDPISPTFVWTMLLMGVKTSFEVPLSTVFANLLSFLL